MMGIDDIYDDGWDSDRFGLIFKLKRCSTNKTITPKRKITFSRESKRPTTRSSSPTPVQTSTT